MNLQDISSLYEENLINFFNNEKIIELIYKEQYGDKEFNAHKDKYINEYTNIMNNTIFIPYITLEHLENFILSTQQKYGENYIKENYNQELSLLKRLNNTKHNIIKNYSNNLISEINDISPILQDKKLGKKLQSYSFTDVNETIEFIKSLINENINKTNSNTLLFNIKNKQIKKCLNKYTKDIKEKILIETSSYFNHKIKIPNDKYYTSISKDMLENNQFVSQQIGTEQDRNYRYIYLPVFKYKTEKEYLVHAVHEVMHISKEKISKNKYRSGLLERTINKNNGSKLTSKDSILSDIVQTINWNNKTKNLQIPKTKGLYRTYLGNIKFEEIIHHWQTRKVVNKIYENNLNKLIYMPYHNNDLNKIYVNNYEYADSSTEKFMHEFGDLIPQVNSGKMSIHEFKKIVGPSNYNLLAHLYENWTTGITVKARKTNVNTQSSETGIEITYGPEHQLFSKLGEDIINNMSYHAKNPSKKDIIVNKTHNILATDITKIADVLEAKISKKRLSNKQNDINSDIDI